MTRKKTKILPIKVWLDEDSCWNNKPQEEGYTEYIRKDAFIEKAIEWLEEHGKDYWWDMTEQSLEDFRKAMEE